MKKNLSKGLALVDLDGTIRVPKSGGNFIDSPEDQKLVSTIYEQLYLLGNMGYSIYGVSNQGGIPKYKTLRSTIEEMRVTLTLTPHLNRIYFSVDDDEVWVIKRGFKWLDWLPLWLQLPTRYSLHGGEGDNPKYWLGGYCKPNAGMLKLAIANWLDRYGLLNGFSTVSDPIYYKELEIFMAGDRLEDRQAAYRIKVPFVHATKFAEGIIPKRSKEKFTIKIGSWTPENLQSREMEEEAREFDTRQQAIEYFEFRKEIFIGLGRLPWNCSLTDCHENKQSLS